MRIQTERNKRKRIQEEFMSIPKNYQIPVNSTEQVFTLNTSTPIKKNKIVLYKFNTIGKLPDPEKKKTDPDTSS
jgi:hypothetical protein